LRAVEVFAGQGGRGTNEGVDFGALFGGEIDGGERGALARELMLFL